MTASAELVMESGAQGTVSASPAAEARKRAGLLIVGHGSREASANLGFEGLVERYRARHPELDVAHGYVEIAQPHFSDALAELAARCDQVVLLPLFLFAAGHVKNDLPLAMESVRQRFPHVKLASTPVLGVHSKLLELAYERARPLLEVSAEERARTAVVVVGRGASDPDANGDFCKLVRLFGEGRGFHSVTPSFIGITRPLFEESAELLARARPERLVVVPYFLFEGKLTQKLSEQARVFSERYPWIKVHLTPVLGEHPLLWELLDARWQETREGRTALPCDNCHYRAPVAGIVKNVGGLRALLHSVRHTVTHSQAMPHVHAHKPLRKHVLVCTNADCAERGSVALVNTLRRKLKDAGRHHDIRVTRTSCMGRCGEGPTVAVYPDGVWYRGVKEEDGAELVQEHLLEDRLVARLVDNIMQ